MNREEFMRQLESLLQNIPQAEREEAIQYYNDYFDDAGFENEQDVIEALGSPVKVAENIKRDMQGDGSAPKISVNERALVQYQQNAAVKAPQPEKEKLPAWAIVLIVILCVLASPVILGGGAGVLGVLIAIVATWFALIIGAGAAAVVLLAVMLTLIVVGFMCVGASPLTGLALLGSGLLCGGIGLLFLMLTVAMAGIVTPAAVKGIISLFRKKEKTAEA